MLKPAFKRGIKELERYNFTYDILIHANQLVYAEELGYAFPYQKFVIDHIAKPSIKNKEIAAWARDIAAVAKHENVWCKVSGLMTEADWRNWNQHDLTPYLDIVFEAFGTKRLMFGSDWPVCLHAATYTQVYGLVADYTRNFSPAAQEKFFGGNAARFYRVR